ncbi:hypothetical protein CDAR_412741 [Caerostris darwini]|uniref:Uncharacterized protein n=1 Tax=Caerostris darwini TaxID=1538125 RepID=A0AAV4QL42_9ARAC|nr:hypothetical protein CDAR_412741 [Caerostris darwini]
MRNVTCQTKTNQMYVYLHRQNLYETSGQEEMSFSRKFSNSSDDSFFYLYTERGFMIHLSHYPRTETLNSSSPNWSFLQPQHVCRYTTMLGRKEKVEGGKKKKKCGFQGQ